MKLFWLNFEFLLTYEQFCMDYSLNSAPFTSSSNGEPDSNYYAQSRQTGEGFRSASAADCRTEYVCDTPLTTLRRSDNFQIQQPQQPLQG